ncbi:MAG: imidazole glycerol phosphate synthase subunit HisH [Clostridia bacterium]|nr:imidazole glycerol phosphate synthase subunit HisH [Clostridia bacterium]
MLAIIDYGVGNLFSLKSSLDAIGESCFVSRDAAEIRRADRIILPGVGAFGDAAKKLEESGMAELVKELAGIGKPILGICLGMQLLFDRSYEDGVYAGLGLIHGEIRPIADVIPKDYKIPHIGWNQLQFPGEKNPLFQSIQSGDFVYFVHSYYGVDCAESTIAVTEYGAPLTAAVAQGNILGCQFHPEKSGKTGLAILKAFCKMGGERA